MWTPGTNLPLECLEYFHGWATNKKYLIQSVNDTLVWLDLKTIHIQFMNWKMAADELFKVKYSLYWHGRWCIPPPSLPPSLPGLIISKSGKL